MNEHHQILAQIHRMRDRRVEPESVILSPYFYDKLGFPGSIGGISVDVDSGIKTGFEVR